jgi:uncharacterized protein (TIGR03437 family)
MTGDGEGPGAITHADGSLVSTANPAARDETLVLYATGFGLTAALPRLTVGGVPATVRYSGQSPCCVGLNQLNFVIPTDAPTGSDVPIVVTIGNKSSNPVTLPVQ